MPSLPGGGVPSLPGGGAPGGAGSGLLGALAGPAAQALGQLGQGGAAPQPGAASGVPGGAPSQVPGVRPAGPSDNQERADPEKAATESADAAESAHGPATGAAAGSQGSRAPIHLEIELDPEQLNDPVHLTLDPKNPPTAGI